MSNQTEATTAELSIEAAIAADASTRFSFERTLLSHERTLMSWVRTATSLITFGFSIYKFYELELGHLLQPRPHQVIGPREFAMFMNAIGLFALAVATVQNWQYRRHLRKHQLEVPLSLSALVAALISALGLLAMAAIIFKW